MAQKIEKEDLFARQKELAAMFEKIATLNDGERILAESQKAVQKSEELRVMAIVYEQQEKARYGGGKPSPPGIVKVELTEEQRKRVQEETGVRMDVVELEEGRDVLVTGMPIENPQIVEIRAIEKAKQMRAEEAAQAQNKANAMAAAEEIAKANNPDLSKMLAEKLKDPTFAAGVLAKK